MVLGRNIMDSIEHDIRNNDSGYPHDSRADKDSYPHDNNNQCIIL